MRVEIIHPRTVTEPDWDTWRKLRKASDGLASPYFAPEFAQIIGEARKDARIVIARADSGEARAFLPIQVSGLGFARPLGAPFTDYHGPVLSADTEQDIVPFMLKKAGCAAYGYTGLPLSKDVFASSRRSTLDSAVADLTPGFVVYLESRRAEFPKHFKKARRLGRQAEREAGELELAFHAPDANTLETLIGWKREQFARTGLHDVLAAPWVRDMLTRCMMAQSEDFSGVMTTLRINGELVAAELGLRSGALLHGWISGFNPNFSAYSPGILMQERLLKAATENGVTHADLGVGAAHYKKYYASSTAQVSEGLIPAQGVCGALRRAGGDAWRRFESAPIGPVAGVAGKMRRRLDNILAVETTFSGRARGVVQALNRGG